MGRKQCLSISTHQEEKMQEQTILIREYADSYEAVSKHGGEGHLSEAEQARVLMWAIGFETNRHTDITSRNLMVKGSGGAVRRNSMSQVQS